MSDGYSKLQSQLREKMANLVRLLCCDTSTIREDYHNLVRDIAVLLVQTDVKPAEPRSPGDFPPEPAIPVRRAMAVVGDWIRFVREDQLGKKYVENHPNWPRWPDPSHSNLLYRMLSGQEPLTAEEYLVAKKEGMF